MCAIKAWSISSACKNLRAQHPLRAEILCPGKFLGSLIGVHTLNFKANFKLSRLEFFLGGGPPSQLGGALGSLGQSLARVKI